MGHQKLAQDRKRTSIEPTAVTSFPSYMINVGFSLRRLAIRPEAFQAILDDVA